MGVIMQKPSDAINATDFARNGRQMFDEIADGEKERLFVFRKSEPIAVVLNVGVFEAMLREIDILRDQVFAQNRIKSEHKTVSHSEMIERFMGR